MLNKKAGTLHLPGRQAVSSDTRYNKVIGIFLEHNCATYEWGKPIAGYLRNRDYARLYKLAEDLESRTFPTIHEFRMASQLVALIKKYPRPHTDLGFDPPEETAIKKFYDAERRCRISNRRFSSNRWVRSVRFRGKISRMQLIIESILGSLELSDILDESAFGPGSNVGVTGNSTHLGKKFFSKEWTVTPSCAEYFALAILGKPFFADHFAMQNGPEHYALPCYDREVMYGNLQRKLKYVCSNKVSFVPKTAKTHRAIAIEPLGNSFVQKGIDVVMRRKLRRSGCDLRDQTRNQELARRGSIDGTLCTIDLSSASDTISKDLVRLLLPMDWFLLLNSTRSPSYIDPIQKIDVRYEKFASMGNGFCFPLETLIFLSAIRACIDVHKPVVSTHGAYGDDLIVSNEIASEVLDLLRFLGFTPNVQKTFLCGPFRESCGADWYEGQDVRPAYLDFALDSELSLRKFHNSLLRSSWVADCTEEVRRYLRDVADPNQAYMRPLQASRRLDASLNFRLFSEWYERANLDGAFDVPLDLFMSSRWARWNKDEQRWSWLEHVYVPKQDPKFVKSSARYWAFLLGSQGGELHLRRETRHRTIRR